MSFVDALDLGRSTVLDLAAGNGMVASRRRGDGCDVTRPISAGPCLERRPRARFGRKVWPIEFKEADAENLPVRKRRARYRCFPP